METGNFGQVREAYTEARLLFPQEVIEYITAQLPSSAVVLDLGCGTGIATRQLHEQGVDVTGIDADAEMIAVAKEFSPDIAYDVAPANRIPFDNDSLDAVTPFSAFHWFTDNESLAEIKRVLKPGGQFFIVNKNDVAGFRVGYRTKLQEFLGISLPSPKDAYDPAEIIKQAGFTNVSTEVFQANEVFSPEGALRHIQSAGVWSKIPSEKKTAAIELMKDHIHQDIRDGQAVRKLEVVLVSGIN